MDECVDGCGNSQSCEAHGKFGKEVKHFFTKKGFARMVIGFLEEFTVLKRTYRRNMKDLSERMCTGISLKLLHMKKSAAVWCPNLEQWS